MAMTQLALLFMGSFGTLTTIAAISARLDAPTRIISLWLSTFVWALFGMSSFDVIVFDGPYASASEPILPLVYIGLAMAVIVGIFAIWKTLDLIRSETGDANLEGALEP